MISSEDLEKVKKITRLHDEAFWHLQQFDGHAKSSDGAVSIEVEFGNVWERQDGPVEPHVAVAIYSYVVASDTPSYPNFGQRSHYFETVDQALEVVTEWHAKAMSYNPSEEELKEIDELAEKLAPYNPATFPAFTSKAKNKYKFYILIKIENYAWPDQNREFYEILKSLPILYKIEINPESLL